MGLFAGRGVEGFCRGAHRAVGGVFQAIGRFQAIGDGGHRLVELLDRRILAMFGFLDTPVQIGERAARFGVGRAIRGLAWPVARNARVPVTTVVTPQIRSRAHVAGPLIRRRPENRRSAPRAFRDEGFQPFTERHAGLFGCAARSLPKLWRNARHVPRNARSHVRP